MRKFYFIIGILLVFSIITFSQDTVYFKKGSKIDCIVKSVDPKTVTVTFPPVNGTLVRDSLTMKYNSLNVKAIKYSNGKVIKSDKTEPNGRTTFIETHPPDKTLNKSEYSKNIKPQKNSEISNTEKMLMYSDQKKNPHIAMIYSFLLTSTGHAYAGDWIRGLKFTGGRIGCGLIALSGINKDGTIKSKYYIGLAGVIGLGVWEAIDSFNEVEKYNSNLYRKIYGKEKPYISMNIAPIRKGLQLSLSYNF